MTPSIYLYFGTSNKLSTMASANEKLTLHKTDTWLRPCQLFSNQGDKHTSNVSHKPLWKWMTHLNENISMKGSKYTGANTIATARDEKMFGRTECNSSSRRCGAHMPCDRIRLDTSNIHGDCAWKLVPSRQFEQMEKRAYTHGHDVTLCACMSLHLHNT